MVSYLTLVIKKVIVTPYNMIKFISMIRTHLLPSKCVPKQEPIILV